jgi:hypothetical protein
VREPRLLVQRRHALDVVRVAAAAAARAAARRAIAAARRDLERERASESDRPVIAATAAERPSGHRASAERRGCVGG